jgi:HD-GYP domain-containing protein (c-di-GMP phosphodiesterase class II)/DNA-binding CsgD family transcriptional regulator
MADTAIPDSSGVRTAEIIAAISMATDLAVGFPLEHGLRSCVIAARLCDRLDVDRETASQAYFLSLLFYVGCNAPVDVGGDVFGDDDSLTTYATPFRFGTRAEMARGMMRAVAPPTAPPHLRAWRLARHFPELAIGFAGVVDATCEVARMLTDELGLGPPVSNLVAFESARWDGKGFPGGVAGDEIPFAVRIAHVARDAAFQLMIGESEFAAEVINQRAAQAFDPVVARTFTRDAAEILDFASELPLWDLTLGCEPKPWLKLDGEALERALAAMGHFTDMAIPEFVGHSSGVAGTCLAAAEVLSFDSADTLTVHRAALVHDLGRAAVPVRIWSKTGSLTLDDWERIRLHAYHTERILTQSPFLSELVPTAGFHHERVDGSGYHRGAGASSLQRPARLLAAADAYHAMTEPRPHRAALSPSTAAGVLAEEAKSGRLDPEAVAAVLEGGGHGTPSVPWPAGLTEREVQVVRLLARGLQTKQIARALEISHKTVDFHIQSAYRKMGVSTRAGATLFAMQHGLTTWENSR